jgi:predicted permease
MRWLANMAAGVKSLFQKRRLEHELDEELESFLAASIENKLRSGMSRTAARQAALIEMGSRNAVKHQVWSSRWESTLEGILADLRISFRTLVKSPGYTAVALVSLALGIGGNTAIFTLINQVLLRNLPVRDPQQLVAFGDSESAGIAGGIDLGQFGGYFPWDFARQLEEDPGPFQGIAAYGSFSDKVTLRLSAVSGGDAHAPALLAPANLVSGNYFSVLGAEPLLGRAIFPSDDATPGSGAVVVLSYHLWRESLSADPHIVGKSISLNGAPFEVIGVMREGFHGIKQELEPADLWAPISMQATVLQFPSMLTAHSGLYFLHLFGRLSPKAVADKAEFLRSQNWLNENVHNGIRDRSGSAISAERQQEISRELVPLLPAGRGVSMIRSEYGESLKILMAVVALVLLIACANLGNFLLARGARRRHETTTRLALGSSRMRLVRQSLVEAFLLSMIGGLLGLGVAFGATRALIAFVSQGDPYIAMRPTPDLKVLGFTLAVSLLTGFLFGLAPAISAARTGARGTLGATARTVQGGSGRLANFWPKSMVSAQVMISLLLLVVAGLFLRSLRNLENQDYGFERTRLLLAQINERLGGYAPHQAAALHQQLLERLAAIPGVRSVALSQMPPISGGSWTSSISLSGYTPGHKENMVSVLNRVTGRYFETAGISIVAGRAIADADTANSLKVAVVSETLAKHYFPNGRAIGRILSIDMDSVHGPWQIVGVARDTRPGNPRDVDPVRMTYIPLAQIDPYVTVKAGKAGAGAASTASQLDENQNCYANTMLLRTAGDPAKTIAALRSAVAAVNPNLPLLEITTIQEQVSNLISHDELISTLTGLFSILALLLAAIGLYGVMSYNVARRTNEIGIRLALGAQASSVEKMILRESVLLLAVGTVLGLPLALLATRLIKQQMFGLDPLDPLTFAVALVVITGTTLITGWLPARRAAKVDPVVALRYE